MEKIKIELKIDDFENEKIKKFWRLLMKTKEKRKKNDQMAITKIALFLVKQ